MAQKLPIQYAKILLELTRGKSGADLDTALKAYAGFLADERVLKKTPYILKAFERLAKEEEGIQEMTITTAHDMPNTVLDKIKKAFDGKVEATTAVDESIIGGMIVQTNNAIIDGSIKTQLDKLQTAFTS